MKHPAVPFVAPFAVFMALLVLQPYNPLPGPVEQVVRVLILAGAIWFFSRGVLDFKLAEPVMSTLAGVAIFAIWIAPDLLIPGYRSNYIFTVVGAVKTSIPYKIFLSRADQKFPIRAEQKGTTSDAGRENQVQYMGLNEELAASDQLFNRNEGGPPQTLFSPPLPVQANRALQDPRTLAT